MFFKNVFSKDPCNTGRQTELDMGKALPIITLAFVHTVIECCTEEQMCYGIPYAFDMFIGGPMSAPMFMFCMGATIHYSKHNTPDRLAKRGVMLLLLGFVLNICRFFMPYMAGYLLTGDTGMFIDMLPYRIFGNDVLQFAGLALLCMALFLKLKTPKWLMFAISLVMAVAGTLLRGTDMGNSVLNIIFGWFIGTETHAGGNIFIISDFPLLNWLITPVCGYIFGWVLQRVKDKKRFYLSFSPVLLTAAIVCLVLGHIYEFGMFGPGENSYYHMYIYDTFICMALTLGLLGLHYAVSRILPEKIKGFITYTSRHITEVYCIHWVFVVWITNVLMRMILGQSPLGIVPVWVIMLVSTGIVLATYLIMYISDPERRVLTKRKNVS